MTTTTESIITLLDRVQKLAEKSPSQEWSVHYQMGLMKGRKDVPALTSALRQATNALYRLTHAHHVYDRELAKEILDAVHETLKEIA